MVTKTVKSKKVKSIDEEKPRKIIKKADSETAKLNKMKTKVKAALAETPEPELAKAIKLPAKQKKSKKSAKEPEIPDVEVLVSDAEEANMEDDAEASNSDAEEAEIDDEVKDDSSDDEVDEDEDDEDEAEEATLIKAEKAKRNKKMLNKETKLEAPIVEEEECDVGLRQTVFVNSLPPHISRSELSNLFVSCGNIMSILFVDRHKKIVFKISKRLEAKSAYIVFDSIVAATKALELNGTLLNEHKLFVGNPETYERLNSGKSVKVSSLKPAAADSLRRVFSSCGEINLIILPKLKEDKFLCFVCFKTREAVRLALELNNTLLDDQTITVSKYENKKKSKVIQPPAAPQTAQPSLANGVFVKNLRPTTTDNLNQFLSICGEINHIKILPQPLFGAVVYFKSPNSVNSALELDGTLKDEQPVSVTKYIERIKTPNKSSTNRTTVFVKNLSSSIKKGNLAKFFAAAGQMKTITIKESDKYDTKFAFIVFKDAASVKRAIELSGSKLKENQLFVYPYKENTKKPTAPFKNLGKEEFQHKMQKKGIKYLKNNASGIGKASDGTKKRSEFRGVRTEGIKKTPKKALI